MMVPHIIVNEVLKIRLRSYLYNYLVLKIIYNLVVISDFWHKKGLIVSLVTPRWLPWKSRKDTLAQISPFAKPLVYTCNGCFTYSGIFMLINVISTSAFPKSFSRVSLMFIATRNSCLFSRSCFLVFCLINTSKLISSWTTITLVPLVWSLKYWNLKVLSKTYPPLTLRRYSCFLRRHKP